MSHQIRILCFNIHGGYDLKRKRDLSRVHDLMERLNVDIGVFQEMETRPTYGGTAEDVDILAGPNRPHHLPGPTVKEGLGWYGNLIVSRYPIRRALVHDLEIDRTIELEPRNAVDALIETPGRPIRVIGTHLSLSPFQRWSEVRNLIKLMDSVEIESKHPVFLMGDINEWRWPNKLIRHLDKLMSPLPCGKTFPSIYPIFRLDRVWCDDPAIKATARTLNGDLSALSDHLPILVEINNFG